MSEACALGVGAERCIAKRVGWWEHPSTLMRLSLQTRGKTHTHTQKSHSTKESWRPQVKSYWNTRFGLVFLFSLRSFQVWWSLPNVHMQICKETEVPLWISGISAQSFKQPEISEFIWFKPSLAIPFMHYPTMRMNSVSLSLSYKVCRRCKRETASISNIDPPPPLRRYSGLYIHLKYFYTF